MGRHFWLDTRNGTSSFAASDTHEYICSTAPAFVFLTIFFAALYAYSERARRRRIAEEKGGRPAAQGHYLTSLLECVTMPRVCVPAFFFLPIQARLTSSPSSSSPPQSPSGSPSPYPGSVQPC